MNTFSLVTGAGVDPAGSTSSFFPFFFGAGAGGACAACALMRAVATGTLFAAGFSGIFHVAFSATMGTASTVGAGFGSV